MHNASSTDRIEKEIVLEASQSRVWRAITDYRQFNTWFGVELTSPLAAGQRSSGNITNKGYEHIVMNVWVETVQPESVFSFRWHPGLPDPEVDYSKEPTTLVTFTLEPEGNSTKLRITESGFDALPESRRAAAFKSNDGGWASQAKRVAEFLRANP